MRGFISVRLLVIVIAIWHISSISDVTSSVKQSNRLTIFDEVDRTSNAAIIGSNKNSIESKSFMSAVSLARKKAMAGGTSGFVAGLIQVLTLMWLRTTVNYQYRYGVSMMVAIRELYRQGGISRFYRGLPYAIIQGPLARFGGIAANDASIVFAAYLTGRPESTSRGLLSTALGGVLASLWRVFLMPIDTCKTVLQVDGARGFKSLVGRVRDGDIFALYTGALATIVATIVSHYPWFTVHNILDKYLINRLDTIGLLLRSAFIGFCASAVADTISNSIRVVKTVKQASVGEYMSYRAVILKVHAESGLRGLFGRGLVTRILTNGLQSMLFTVIWKFMSRRNTVEESSASASVKTMKTVTVMKPFPISSNSRNTSTTQHLRHGQH